MDSVKIYYLKLLQNMDGTNWIYIHEKMKSMCTKRFQVKDKHSIRRAFSMQLMEQTPKPIEKIHSESKVQELQDKMWKDLEGILLTTVDAHTLTDGPTIYLVEDVLALAEFYIKHSDISEHLLENIMKNIYYNQDLSEKINAMEQQLEEQLQKADNTDKSQAEEMMKKKPAVKVRMRDVKSDSAEALQFNMNQLQTQIRNIQLDADYIPNSVDHQEKWAPVYKKSAFMPCVENNTIKKIMALKIEPVFKILTLMGVGVLVKQENTNYEEIVKRMAQDQHLFIILTTSDYIYGTNYQFCHGFIGDDLQKMTQQKTLQSMGRIGRNNIQQEYTVRFRDNAMIEKLFQYPDENLEADNMNRLFCH